jgi:hypothetical protein
MSFNQPKETEMTQPKIVFSPLQAGEPAASGALDLLVRVQAPDRPADWAAAHLPKRLALVVDRWGSMNGQNITSGGYLNFVLSNFQTVYKVGLWWRWRWRWRWR